MREHATAMEKAETKIIGLMMGCMKSHKIAVYDIANMNATMQILILTPLSLVTDFSC